MKKLANYLPFAALFILPLLFYPGVHTSSWRSSSDVHAVLEFASSFLAITAGIMILLHFFTTGRWFFLIISIGFVLIGTEEFVHALFSFGKIWLETSPTFKLAIPSTWLTGHFILLTSFFAALIFGEREIIPAKRGLVAVVYNIIGLICAASVALLIFYSPFLPQFVQLGSITKKLIELSLALIYFVAFLFYSNIYLKQQSRSPLLWSIIACIIFQVLAHIFVFDAQAFYDAHWDSAHLLVFLSYFFPIFGVWGETIKLHRAAQVQLIELGKEMTERKLAEEDLRESEEKWQSLVSNSPDFIALHDREGKYLFLNHYAEGFTEKDVLGKKGLEFVSHESRELYKTKFEECIHTLTKQFAEYSAMGDSVKVRIYESTFVPIIGHGSEINVLVVAKDITDRKQAEEEMRDSETRFRNLFENSLMGISTATPDGRLIQVNLAYAHMYGYDKPEKMMAEVKNVGQLYANPEDRKEVLRILAERGVMEPKEMEVVQRDGTRFFVLVSAREVRDSSGKLLILQASHIDITERKRAEEEISKSHEELRMLANHLQNIREEERNHLAREFHDQIGQSMTALKMDLSLLLRTISDEKQDVPRKLILKELQSMQKLVDETSQLLWAIITELRPQMLDDLGLVATLEWEAQRFESRTGISCEFKSTAGDIPLDSKKSIALFRIYQEALTNITRHAHATIVKSGLQRDGEMLVLAIKDNGCGISIDEQFKQKPFGLIGMRERAMALGGQLKISGIAGGGTTIIVRVPL